ncbi:hypothetical protein KXV64_001906 [Aspergillus fumigatus]|nr:hypothetical protein KXX42_002139 [Aspergillus fumigatus]KAH1985486.1 hypothetical protein KXW88_000420 [Aspergillus fumigatus]KAH2306585.1 hypothetical protein KXV47_007704 [Aspergillus fumigatus]KAH2751854.1 hypothetical protein KXV94_002275 [Aspergillus fumigatus]KAH3206059.1 hypothetical protein KXW62_003578 [Aspergillus fumigatus]
MMSLVTLLATTLLYLMCYASPLIKRATLTEVTNFGGNPASIRMYIYVPDTLAASPGIVVSLHGASGNAQQQYQSTPYARLADTYGFIAVFPESPQGAWDATSSESLVHEGGGTSQSIANMAKYVLNTYSADASKVYVSGVSSGGTMANTMAGTYPDVFKGFIIYSAGSAGNIRSMFPGYTGTYPKIQIYLGSEDTVIGSAAFNTTLAAWASVLWYDTTPDELLANTPRRRWTTYVLGDKLDGIWAEGVGHPVPIQGDEDMKWWGFA